MTKKDFILSNNGVFDKIILVENGRCGRFVKVIDGAEIMMWLSCSYVRRVLKQAYGSVDMEAWKIAVLNAAEAFDDRMDHINLVGFIEDKENDEHYELFIHECDTKLSDVPHVHMVDVKPMKVGPSRRGGKLNACVRLDRAEYFLHGDYKDTLNERQRMLLAEFMENPYVENDSYRCETVEHIHADLAARSKINK